jgi:putative PIN family toxin of toxin-antitoxin system
VRIVLDTAALIAALRSNRGAAAEILRRIVRGEIVLLLDYKLSLEYRAVALRPEHLSVSGRSRQDTLDLIEVLEDLADPVEVLTMVRPLSSDPDDDMVLDVALNAQADAIVTNNARHFAATGRRFGIPILSPLDLLLLIREGDQDANSIA